MIHKQVLKEIRTMKRKGQDYRLIVGMGCVRRIDLDDKMRQLLTDSFQRVLDWQGDNIDLFGIDLVWEGFVSKGHDPVRHLHYLVVTLQGFKPASAEEFDRVFFKGLEPTNGIVRYKEM